VLVLIQPGQGVDPIMVGCVDWKATVAKMIQQEKKAFEADFEMYYRNDLYDLGCRVDFSFHNYQGETFFPEAEEINKALKENPRLLTELKLLDIYKTYNRAYENTSRSWFGDDKLTLHDKVRNRFYWIEKHFNLERRRKSCYKTIIESFDEPRIKNNVICALLDDKPKNDKALIEGLAKFLVWWIKQSVKV
jgi:hypothetical protein